ncbi:hypothetical protein [Bradyrhizobium guangdongense]|uniref:hypothetical protein n=1 Tax=Bradyrhizobium guangdongense TaxID=1325090 RepID=UPI00112E5A7E|nr:hypothetical protein [Bradyrhizobium guangdongense]
MAISALFGLLGASGTALGQTVEAFPQFRIDSSIPLQYGANVLLTPFGSRQDLYVSPSLKLSALGEFDPTLLYSIYLAGNPDAYRRVTVADDGVATLGGRLDKILDAFSVGAIYNHTLAFDGIYRAVSFQADDFSGYVGYTYQNKPAGLKISPSVSAAYRFSDLATQERLLVTMKAEIRQALADKLTLIVTPSFKYYSFTSGTAAGKRNVLPSIVGALSYSINDDVSVGASVEYDRRWSNRIGSDFDNVIFLASVTFGHTYDLFPKNTK